MKRSIKAIKSRISRPQIFVLFLLIHLSLLSTAVSFAATVYGD